MNPNDIMEWSGAIMLACITIWAVGITTYVGVMASLELKDELRYRYLCNRAERAAKK